MARRDWIRASLLPAAAWVCPTAHAVDYLSPADAQKALFPAATSFEQRPVTLTEEQRDRIKELAGTRQREEQPRVWRASGPSGPLGWFLVDDVIGKHEFITYAAGVSEEGKVLGVEILSYRETHGGQVREADWRGHFAGKTLADPFKLEKDIPNISGATLSCRNVTNGVKRLLAIVEVALGSPAPEM